MIALRITYSAGHFHAMPWNKNDGDIEWPPSPWRLLHAFLVAWIAIGEPEPALFSEILDVLAEPPAFLLPPITEPQARSRTSQEVLAQNDTPLVLDAFTAVEKSTAALVIWRRATLDVAERELFVRVAAAIERLGPAALCRIDLETDQSQDTVQARLIADDRYVPVELASRSAENGPTVRRRVAMPGVRGIGLRAALEAPDGVIRRANPAVPPASAWADYRFPPHFGFAPAPSVAFVRPVTMPRRVERFALEARNKALLPSVTETIVVAEAFRNAAMKQFSSLYGSASSPTLSGKAENGTKGLGHQHPYFLPRDLDDDGRIDHVDVYFPAGSTHDEHCAVLAVNVVYDRLFDPRANRRFVTTSIGKAEMVSAVRWTTETPCILDRQPKRRDLLDTQQFLSGQVAEMLLRHGVEAAVKSVSVWPSGASMKHREGQSTLLQSFRSARSNGPRLPPFGLTIEFEEAQAGPIVFGRFAHFGLGQLRPVT